MKTMVEQCGDVLKLKGRGHLFYTVLQFGRWYRVLLKESEEEAIVQKRREAGCAEEAVSNESCL